jgi:hypothetical protein
MPYYRRHFVPVACADQLAVTILCLVTLAPAFGQEGKAARTWAFTHPPDPFTAKAVLDLRSLNEKEAGQSGFLRLTPDGQGFALGNGKPVRLWAVGSDVYRRGSRQDMARHARFLAKIGVNMVRIHTQLAPGPKGSNLTDVDQAEIDRIRQCVAALKKEGIYTTISPYWATGRDVTRWGIDGYTRTTDLWALLFFDEKLQEGYKAWIKALYQPKNPYTGIPLARDPAVGLIQVQNEDSLLFWTTQGIKPAQVAQLGKRFGHWLVQKYGSLDRAKKSWGGTGHEKDDFAAGTAGLFIVWHLTQPAEGGLARRLHDQLEFLAETQRRFYQDMAANYRKQLGCKQLLNASNWVTVDPIRLNDVERWTYAALDVIAVNKYTGGVHTGANNGWRIDPGHHFTNRSCLTDPRGLPTNLKQVIGHPMIVTESTWVHPERYQAEGPFLVAAYQSLTGMAGFYWFSATAAEFDLDPSLRFLNLNGQHPLFKWSCSTPSLMGTFPAAALLYRKGYLRPSRPVVHEERPLEDLWERKVPLIAEDRSFDPNRYTGTTGARSHIKGGADPLAFLVGRVEVKYGGDRARTTVANLARYIDRKNQVVRSITGEVRLDYGTGLCTVDGPRAQGACGFLSKSGPIALGDVTIRSGNDYAAVLLVPLDDKPLRTSRKILVQTGTSARLTGWKARPSRFAGDGKQMLDGYEIMATGQPPWQIVDTDVSLVVGNPNLKTATLLDTAGYRAKKVEGRRSGGKFIIKLPANALYVVLES